MTERWPFSKLGAFRKPYHRQQSQCHLQCLFVGHWYAQRRSVVGDVETYG